MRAAVLERHGAAPTLVDRPPPARVDGHALVTTTAAPITPLDILCATGTSYFGAPALPYVPGVQGVGVVAAAKSVPSGTRVWFPTVAGMQPGDGSMAEQVSVPESELVALADQPADALVAALGLSAIAAWMALTWKAGLRPGEQVLVLGGGSVVGQVAIQAAPPAPSNAPAPAVPTQWFPSVTTMTWTILRHVSQRPATATWTSSSTRSAAYRPRRLCFSLLQAPDSSTWEAPQGRAQPSRPLPSGVVRPRSSATRTTRSIRSARVKLCRPCSTTPRRAGWRSTTRSFPSTSFPTHGNARLAVGPNDASWSI